MRKIQVLLRVIEFHVETTEQITHRDVQVAPRQATNTNTKTNHNGLRYVMITLSGRSGTHLMPRQLRGPLANATSQASKFSDDGSSHRSGLNLYGSGNMLSS